MTYDLYDLILDLTEAGFTVRFKPMFTDDKPYRPEYINIVIRNDTVISANNPSTHRIRELGQDELVREMIGMTKYAVRQMEDKNEPSTTQGTGPTE